MYGLFRQFFRQLSTRKSTRKNFLIYFSIQRPVAVAVGVLFVALFGTLALLQIPIQLTPDVRKPMITVDTRWSGASPLDMEREITLPQEEALKAIPGLFRMKSSSYGGRSKIKLEFRSGTSMDTALMLVSNRLQRINSYPDEAGRPTLKTADSDDAPITWMMLQRRHPDDQRPISEVLDFAESVIQPALERVPGVAAVNLFGGQKQALQVTIDPDRAAARGITIAEVAHILKEENQTVSGGSWDDGKRRYVVRTIGALTTPDQLDAVVVRGGPETRITLGEIASTAFEYQDPTVTVRGNGRPAIAVNAVREQGANVLRVMEGIREAVEQLNHEILPEQGLRITIQYDQTDYIHAAIRLVRNNLWIGALIAMGILLIFLRSLSAMAIVALAIPISVMGAFLCMALLGRSINVVSLAGMAFAVGMVVDPAIVTLENIIRLRDSGKPPEEASLMGVSQVWGALLIATVTTGAVFLPILLLKIEVAQLFGDIAVALSAAVLFSLLVSTTVIPALGAHMIRAQPQKKASHNTTLSHPNLLTRTLLETIRWIIQRLWARLAIVVFFVGGAVFTIQTLMPPAEYLPVGNRNLIFGMLIPPPGYNLEEMTHMAESVEQHVRPHWESGLMRHFFFVARGAVAFMGGAASDPTRIQELIPLIRKPIRQAPGVIGMVHQSSLFGRGIGRGRSLELEITGPDLNQLLEMTRNLFGKARALLPEAQIRPVPGLELGNPELQFLPDRIHAQDNGLSTREIGQAVDVFTSGMKVSEVMVNGREIPLILRAGSSHSQKKTTAIQSIAEQPLVTASGKIVPLSSVADTLFTVGPIQINHVERERTVALRISPPLEMPLERAVEQVREQLIRPVLAEGLPSSVQLRLAEGADQLKLAKSAMGKQLLLACVITFLLMAALFESFLYPLIILVTVPLAAAGGLMGLWFLNLFRYQPMDVLTMLGFVILIGIVINNAILIVHQALRLINPGSTSARKLSPEEAVITSVRMRVRPILLLTLTSVCGMLPLTLFPGAGSELYRGLGSVIIGGLLLATLLTLILTPVLFHWWAVKGSNLRPAD